jgi:hypothetical protein
MACNRAALKASLQRRGIRGDSLLNALDLAETLEEKGGTVNCNGTVKLYHRTSHQKAKLIVSQQAMFGEEDGLFFSTSPTGDYVEAFGPAVIMANLPLEKLELNDIFSDQAHVRLPTRVIGKRIPIKVEMR